MSGRLARGLGIVAVVWLPTVLGCSDGAAPRSGEPVSALSGLTGELESRIVRLRNGRSETRYRLRLPDGSTEGLRFSETPHVRIGTSLTVWGSRAGDSIQVESFAMMNGEGEL